jgi:hypothetical protein
MRSDQRALLDKFLGILIQVAYEESKEKRFKIVEEFKKISETVK